MDSPVSLAIHTPAQIARWRVLSHGFLLIPHLIIFYILSLVAQLIWVIAWVVGTITGKIPRALAAFFVMQLRYNLRIDTYLFVLTDTYVPFDFSSDDADPGNYPTQANFKVDYGKRSRLLVLFRPILAIPVIIWLVILGVLEGVIFVISFFVLLVIGRWPKGMRNAIIGVLSADLRANAYMCFLTDRI